MNWSDWRETECRSTPPCGFFFSDPAADCAIGSRPPPSASGDSEAEASVPPSAAVAGSDPEVAVAGEEPTWMTLRVPFELWNERSSVDETLPKEVNRVLPSLT